MSLEQNLETLRSLEAGGLAGRWGTAAASVLGDLAVVFRVDVPAQADGQEHPQELSGQRAGVRGRTQGSISLCRSARVPGLERDGVDPQRKPQDQPVAPAAEAPREGTVIRPAWPP